MRRGDMVTEAKGGEKLRGRHIEKERTREMGVPRIVHLLQLVRYDGPPPLPLETVGLLLHHAFSAARAALGPLACSHLNKLRLDDGAVEIERRDTRRRGRGEMYAMQTAARWTERRVPSEWRLLIGPFVSCSALFEDRKDW